MAIRICEIDTRYTTYLGGFDPLVSREHIGANPRKFLGIIMDLNGIQYYAPMSSPKSKHTSLNPKTLDIYKIDEGKLGIVNLNNMIPVPPQAVIAFDISDIKDEKYKLLLTEQARLFRRDEIKIVRKANVLYNKVGQLDSSNPLKKRCCDFKMLEQKALDYVDALNP